MYKEMLKAKEEYRDSPEAEELLRCQHLRALQEEVRGQAQILLQSRQWFLLEELRQLIQQGALSTLKGAPPTAENLAIWQGGEAAVESLFSKIDELAHLELEPLPEGGKT